MIQGIGVDACQISRMAKQLKSPHFMSRLFAPEEIAYIERKSAAAAQSLAAMFAAKEAALKALGLGLGGAALCDIVILHRESGQPYYDLRGNALAILKGGHLHLSITHEADLAIAMAVYEKDV